MNTEDSSCHECLGILLLAASASMGFIFLIFGDNYMETKEKIFTTVILSILVLLMLTLFICALFGIWNQCQNKNKYFALNSETINKQMEVNTQKRIGVDKDITEIPARYFSGNNILEEIEFYSDPQRTLHIKEFAFFTCKNLKRVKIVGKDICIEPNAFAGCKKFKIEINNCTCFYSKEETDYLFDKPKNDSGYKKIEAEAVVKTLTSATSTLHFY